MPPHNLSHITAHHWLLLLFLMCSVASDSVATAPTTKKCRPKMFLLFPFSSQIQLVRIHNPLSVSVLLLVSLLLMQLRNHFVLCVCVCFPHFIDSSFLSTVLFIHLFFCFFPFVFFTRTAYASFLFSSLIFFSLVVCINRNVLV